MTLNNIGYNVHCNVDKFMTCSEDLKRLEKTIQLIQTLDFANADIVNLLHEKALDRYKYELDAVMTTFSRDTFDWASRNQINDLPLQIRKDIESIEYAIKSIEEAYGKIDTYKDEKDERIESLKDELKNKDAEIEKLKDDIKNVKQDIISKYADKLGKLLDINE